MITVWREIENQRAISECDTLSAANNTIRARVHCLIHLGVRDELRRCERRHLVGGRGATPVVGACAAAFWALTAEPIPCRFPAAAAKASGCVVTNDIMIPSPR